MVISLTSSFITVNIISNFSRIIFGLRVLFALKRLPSLIEANIKRKQSAFVILREISWNFSFEIFLLLNCLDSDLQRWTNDLVKFLKKQTKLEKKKKL